MATRSYTSRRELEQYSFHPAMTLLVPLGAILLQVMLPKMWWRLGLLDLPLIATIFFAVARRSPVAGTLTGALIGLAQDALTNQPIGVNGMAKCVVGYAAASIGVRVDVENVSTRVLLNFGFSMLQSLLLYLIRRNLLGMQGMHVLWLHELIRALANTVVAIPVFMVLDRGKRMI
jgi:rod shape-determining protein MreD